jgi:hypothetical protein
MIMKYSLRSLTTFSIRELFLVTIIVALAVGWCVDHWSHADAHEDARFLADVTLNDVSHDDLPRLRELCKKYGVKPKGEISIHLQGLPNSSAPVPNPPKP